MQYMYMYMCIPRYKVNLVIVCLVVYKCSPMSYIQAHTASEQTSPFRHPCSKPSLRIETGLSWGLGVAHVYAYIRREICCTGCRE
jgi:hypothetical protein